MLAWGLRKKERAVGKVNKTEAGKEKTTLKKKVRGQKRGREGGSEVRKETGRKA